MDVFKKLKDALGIYSFKANAVLKDGTEIVVDGNLEVGVSVYVITPDGNKPLPNGEYELDTGEKIVVEDGAITEVMPVEETPEEEPVEEPIEETPTDDAPTEETPTEEPVEEPTDEPVEETPDVEAQISELNDRVSALEEALASLMSSQEELKNENTELKKEKEEFSIQLKEVEEKLSKMDGASPLNKRKVEKTDNDLILSKTTSQRIKNLNLFK